jgi:predicted ribosomally synthesized peptide with nif11-like leader
MSKQQVIEFFQAASKDQVIAEKIKAAINPSSLLEIASENGYEFTEQDLLQFKLEQVRISLGDIDVLEDLPDEQLEAVAGGTALEAAHGVARICFSTHWTNVARPTNPCGPGSCFVL